MSHLQGPRNRLPKRLKEKSGARPGPLTHSLVQEQGVARQVVSAQEAAEDSDGALEQVDVYVLGEGQLFGHPSLGLLKLCPERKRKSPPLLRFPSLCQQNAVTGEVDSGVKPGSSTFLQAHDPHGVQSVDEGQSQVEPLSVRLGNGLQLVVTPGEILVALPGVSESLLYCLQPCRRVIN